MILRFTDICQEKRIEKFELQLNIVTCIYVQCKNIWILRIERSFHVLSGLCVLKLKSYFLLQYYT